MARGLSRPVFVALFAVAVVAGAAVWLVELKPNTVKVSSQKPVGIAEHILGNNLKMLVVDVPIASHKRITERQTCIILMDGKGAASSMQCPGDKSFAVVDPPQ